MSVTLDIVIAVLLACTIGYAYILNRRLSELKRDKSQLEKLVVSFAHATERAEASVAQLRDSADQVTCQLQIGIGDAESLREDLKFLLERGEGVADRLEGGVRASRDTAMPAEPERSRTPMGFDPAGAEPKGLPPIGVETRDLAPSAVEQVGGELTVSRSDAERELIRALQSAR